MSKTVLVTGGAKGIGFASCARLREAGADVLVADLDLDAATDAVARLGQVDSAGRVDVFEVDVADAGRAHGAGVRGTSGPRGHPGRADPDPDGRGCGGARAHRRFFAGGVSRRRQDQQHFAALMLGRVYL